MLPNLKGEKKTKPKQQQQTNKKPQQPPNQSTSARTLFYKDSILGIYLTETVLEAFVLFGCRCEVVYLTLLAVKSNRRTWESVFEDTFPTAGI